MVRGGVNSVDEVASWLYMLFVWFVFCLLCWTGLRWLLLIMVLVAAGFIYWWWVVGGDFGWVV